MSSRSSLAVVFVVLLAPAALAASAEGSPATRAPVGQLALVQALPDATVDVSIDGDMVESDVGTAEVLGPYDLAAGPHRIDFSGDGTSLATTVTVQASSSQDVVVHLPASVGGAAVATAYATPNDPIGPDKARVLVAHTATVPPADVIVDGQVVFSNIANGEFATADVPAGTHVVELLPTGQTSNPILGPLDVEVAPLTATMVYAIGNLDDDSMGLVAHTLELSADGAIAPESIATGSAGLAAFWRVVPFGAR